MGLILLTGGARSGKSELAVRMASARTGEITFVATAEVSDDDMAARVARHRSDRPAHWTTIECPVELVGALNEVRGTVVVDCLTLWVSNLMLAGHDDDEIENRASDAAKAAAGLDAIVVTNEVGSGVHPGTELGRRYRDLLGRVNKIFGAEAEEVFLVVAGRVLRLQELSL